MRSFGASPGVASPSDHLEHREFTAEEMRAICDEAEARGLKVAAHAHSINGIDLAIANGVRDLQHISFMDEAQVERAFQRHAERGRDGPLHPQPSLASTEPMAPIALAAPALPPARFELPVVLAAARRSLPPPMAAAPASSLPPQLPALREAMKAVDAPS